MSDRSDAIDFNTLKASLPEVPVSEPGSARTIQLAIHGSGRLTEGNVFVNRAAGGRNDQLTRVAGKLIERRLALDEVLALCQSWNRGNSPPLPEEEVERTCISIWETNQRNHPAANDVRIDEPLFDLADAKIDRFLDSPAPARRYLLKDCLPLGQVGSLVAPGGTSKSMFAIQLGVSVAAGLRFLDLWNVDEPGGVLIVAAEDDQLEIHRRLQSVVLSLAASKCDPAAFLALRKNLHIKSMVAQENLMTRANDRGIVALTTYGARLSKLANEIDDLKLIIIDPASRFRGGNENSAEDVTRFVEAVEQVRTTTGATVLVVHHASKASMSSGEQSQSASRGSSAWSDGIRWQMNLATFSPLEAKSFNIPEGERLRYLRASLVKNNYGPPLPPVILLRGDGGVLVSSILTPNAAAKTESLRSKILRYVKDEADVGRFYSRTMFEDQFGGIDGLLGVGKGAVRKELREMVSTRALREEGRKLKPPLRAKIPTVTEQTAGPIPMT